MAADKLTKIVVLTWDSNMHLIESNKMCQFSLKGMTLYVVFPVIVIVISAMFTF